jgi:hypothetical protein
VLEGVSVVLAMLFFAASGSRVRCFRFRRGHPLRRSSQILRECSCASIPAISRATFRDHLSRMALPGEGNYLSLPSASERRAEPRGFRVPESGCAG